MSRELSLQVCMYFEWVKPPFPDGCRQKYKIKCFSISWEFTKVNHIEVYIWRSFLHATPSLEKYLYICLFNDVRAIDSFALVYVPGATLPMMTITMSTWQDTIGRQVARTLNLKLCKLRDEFTPKGAAYIAHEPL